MIRIRHAGLALSLAALACGEFKQQADVKFGDQNFKTAIALIELHHTRTGAYPATLQDLQFVGEWDRIAISAVKYERLPDGYALDLERGWVGTPALTYPPEFWRGLGIRRSNVKSSGPAT